MYLLGCIVASTGGTSLKFHTRRYTHIRYEGCTCGCDQSIIKQCGVNGAEKNVFDENTKQVFYYLIVTFF
jgi:hypothetical protein